MFGFTGIHSIAVRVFFTVALTALLFACATVHEQELADKEKFNIADTNLRLGLGYLQQGKDDAALEKLKKAVAAMPEYAEAHSSLALAYTRFEMPEMAAEHYQYAIEIKPEDGSIQNNYAVFLCSQGKYAEAEQRFLAAIKSRKYRTPAQALENLGVCMLQVPDLKKAETYLRKALRLDARLPRALLTMARVSMENQRLMSGRAYLQRYQDVAQLGSDGLWLGILVEKKLGDADAVREYKSLLRQNYANSNEMRLLLKAEEIERAEAAAK